MSDIPRARDLIGEAYAKITEGTALIEEGQAMLAEALKLSHKRPAIDLEKWGDIAEALKAEPKRSIASIADEHKVPPAIVRKIDVELRRST